MRQFSYASMITPVSLSQFRSALSYSMPVLNAAGISDPASIMFMTSMMQTAGITNSKSGTWLRSFYEGLGFRGGKKNEHDEALIHMGLVDEFGNPTYKVTNPDGTVNNLDTLNKISQTINRYQKSGDSPEERLKTVHAAFGERGGGVASMMALDQWIGQMPVLEEKMKSFKGGDQLMSYLMQNAPLVQMDKVWSDMQVTLLDIGVRVLPLVLEGLKGFDWFLQHIADLSGLFKVSPHIDLDPGDNMRAVGHALGFGRGIYDRFGQRYSQPSQGGGYSLSHTYGPVGLVGAAGTYRPIRSLSDADVSDDVVNTIAGEASTNNPAAIDAVINNMFNRLGTKTYGPSSSLNDVATAPGQYTGYRRATPAEAAMIRDRIRQIASGAVSDNTNHSMEYRGAWLYDKFAAEHPEGVGVGGNWFFPTVPTGPYGAYDHPHSQWMDAGVLERSYRAQQERMSDPESARGREIHIHNNLTLDWKTVAKSTVKQIIRQNQFVYGPSAFDPASLPSGIDHGLNGAQ